MTADAPCDVVYERLIAMEDHALQHPDIQVLVIYEDAKIYMPLEDHRDLRYGFRCTITGVEWWFTIAEVKASRWCWWFTTPERRAQLAAALDKGSLPPWRPDLRTDVPRPPVDGGGEKPPKRHSKRRTP